MLNHQYSQICKYLDIIRKPGISFENIVFDIEHRSCTYHIIITSTVIYVRQIKETTHDIETFNVLNLIFGDIVLWGMCTHLSKHGILYQFVDKLYELVETNILLDI